MMPYVWELTVGNCVFVCKCSHRLQSLVHPACVYLWCFHQFYVQAYLVWVWLCTKQLHCVQQILGDFQPPSRDQQEQTHCMMQMNKNISWHRWTRTKVKANQTENGDNLAPNLLFVSFFIYNTMRAKEDKAAKLSCVYNSQSCCRLQGNHEQQKQVHFS